MRIVLLLVSSLLVASCATYPFANPERDIERYHGRIPNSPKSEKAFRRVAITRHAWVSKLSYAQTVDRIREGAHKCYDETYTHEATAMAFGVPVSTRSDIAISVEEFISDDGATVFEVRIRGEMDRPEGYRFEMIRVSQSDDQVHVTYYNRRKLSPKHLGRYFTAIESWLAADTGYCTQPLRRLRDPKAETRFSDIQTDK